MAAAEVGVSAGTRVSPTLLSRKFFALFRAWHTFITFDDIVKICTDFERNSEIMEAQSLLEKCSIIMHKRRGPRRIVRLLKILLSEYDSSDILRYWSSYFVSVCVIIFGHAHLHSRTDGRGLRTEYYIVDIPHDSYYSLHIITR